MVREYWREVVPRDASGNGESLSSEVVFIIWGVLVMLSLITAAIFSCADGASKDKTSATHNDAYGAACAAGCGGACGG
uniref:Transmembrane protein n=1 Tax=Quercus lobata TaxID=97700 RepID=A0A7N2KLP8_QUELO